MMAGTAACWQVFAPGVLARVLHRTEAGRVQTLLLRLAPGARLPAHPHNLDEECFVVDGSLFIGNHRLQSGDMHIAAAGSQHDAVHSPRGATLIVRAEVGEWEHAGAPRA
jgi:quercetin dioxygenase-like cupin family protein